MDKPIAKAIAKTGPPVIIIVQNASVKSYMLASASILISNLESGGQRADCHTPSVHQNE
jgi:hypothetical protein